MAFNPDTIESEDSVRACLHPPDRQRPVNTGEVCFAAPILEPHDELHRRLLHKIGNPQPVSPINNILNVGEEFINARV